MSATTAATRIDADRIAFDGDTAWLVVDACRCRPKPVEGQPHSIACRFGGTPAAPTWRRLAEDGRTVTIEVDVPNRWRDEGPEGVTEGEFMMRRTHRASVVPGMVLPIEVQNPPCGLHVYKSMSPAAWSWCLCDHGDTERIALPPAAAPDMWAVKLRIDQPVKASDMIATHEQTERAARDTVERVAGKSRNIAL